MQYVELECGILYDTYSDVDKEHENQVTQRVLRLLRVILHDALQNGEVSLKTTIQACDKALLKLFVNVRADYVSENKLVASTITKLLHKLSLLEDINKLKGKNIAFQEDTFLRNPLVCSIRQNLATSDYESDMDDEDDDDMMPMFNGPHDNSVPSPQGIFSHLEEKVNVTRTSTNFDNLSYKFGLKENNLSSSFLTQKVQTESFGPSYVNKQRFAENEENLRNLDNFIDSRSTENRLDGRLEKTFQNRTNSLRENTVKNLHVGSEVNPRSKSNSPLLALNNTSFLKHSLNNKVPSTFFTKQASENSDDFFLVTGDVTRKESSKPNSFSKNYETEKKLRQINGSQHVLTTSSAKSLNSSDNLSERLHNIEKSRSSVIGEDIQEKQNDQNEIATPNIKELVTFNNRTVKSASVDKKMGKNPVSSPLKDCEIIELDEDSCDEELFSRDITSKVKSEVPSSPSASDEFCSLNVPSAVPNSENFTPSTDSIPNNPFHNKSQTAENVNGGIITIEILDDDENDYNGFGSNGTEGLSQFGTTSFNLLQSNEIKQEGNEENRSPNFFIHSSDNDDQNFWSSNKSERGSNSAELNKLGKSTNKDSTKEADASAIVISDSEDELQDGSSACDEDNNNRKTVRDVLNEREESEEVGINLVSSVNIEKENEQQIEEEIHGRASDVKQIEGEIHGRASNIEEPRLHKSELESLQSNITEFTPLTTLNCDKDIQNEREVETNHEEQNICQDGAQEYDVSETVRVESPSIDNNEENFQKLDSDENKSGCHVDAVDENVTHESELEVVLNSKEIVPKILTTEVEDNDQEGLSYLEKFENVDQNQVVIPASPHLEETNALESTLEAKDTTESITNFTSVINNTELNKTMICESKQFHNERREIVEFQEVEGNESSIISTQIEQPPIIEMEQSVKGCVNEISDVSKIYENKITDYVSEITLPQQVESETQGTDDHQIIEVVENESVFPRGESKGSEIRDQYEITVDEKQNIDIISASVNEDETEESKINNSDRKYIYSDDIYSEATCEIPESVDEITSDHQPECVTVTNEFSKTIENKINIEEESNSTVEESKSGPAVEVNTEPIRAETELEEPLSTPCDITDCHIQEEAINRGQSYDAIEIAYENQVEIVEPNVDAEEIKESSVSENFEIEHFVSENDETVEEIKVISVTENIDTVDEIKESSVVEDVKTVEENIPNTETVQETTKSSVTEQVDTVVEMRDPSVSENTETVEETKKSSVTEHVDTVEEMREPSVAKNDEIVEETKKSSVVEHVETVEEIREPSISENAKIAEETKESSVSEDSETVEETKKSSVTEHVDTVEEIRELSACENVKTVEETNESSVTRNVDTVVELSEPSVSENADAVEETKKSTIIENVDIVEEISEPSVSENAKTVEEMKESSVIEKVDTVEEIKEFSVSENVSCVQDRVTEPHENFTSDVLQENSECVQEIPYEAIDYSVNAQNPPQPSDNMGYINQPPLEDNHFQNVQNNVPAYGVEHHQPVLNLQIQTSNVTAQNIETSLSQDVESKNSLALYSLPEVEYNEYNVEKKVGGDLELLANIAADQETLAVKTDSEKEIVDTASEAEIKVNLSQTTPRRRKSKVKLESKKKTLARETLPRAVKGPPRRNVLKQKPNAEETENKRVTRNMGIKSKIDVNVLKEVQKQSRANRNDDSKYKPHDFISIENSILPPRTNNVYAQNRLVEATTTSEDSNDSCGSTLFIDLGENQKHSEKTIKSVYDEDTIFDMLEFVSTEDKATICISIPENEENCVADSFQILKQMEDFVDNNNEKTTVNITKTSVDVEEPDKGSSRTSEDTNSKDNQVSKNTEEASNTVEDCISSPTQDTEETKIVKTTDHSIENILNKAPSNGEVKVALDTYHGEIEFQDGVVAISSVAKEKVASQTSVVESEKQKVAVDPKPNVSKITDEVSQNWNIPIVKVVVHKYQKSEDKTTSEKIIKTRKHKQEISIQVMPEDLTVDKTASSEGKIDETGEKIFKTKAAVKSYEDKLQPNPYVVLQNLGLKQVEPQEELGMRTRSRSKSTEVQVVTRFDRSRSSSIDCNAFSTSSESCHNHSTDTSGFNESGDSIEVTISADFAVNTRATPIQESQEVKILPNHVDEKESLSSKTEVPINDDNSALGGSTPLKHLDEKKILPNKSESNDTSAIESSTSSNKIDEKKLVTNTEPLVNDDTSCVLPDNSSKPVDERKSISNKIKLPEHDDISVLESKHDERESLSNKIELTVGNDISVLQSSISSKHDEGETLSDRNELPIRADTLIVESSASSDHTDEKTNVTTKIESPASNDNSSVETNEVTLDVPEISRTEKEPEKPQNDNFIDQETKIQNNDPIVSSLSVEDPSTSLKNDEDILSSSVDVAAEVTVSTVSEPLVTDQETIQTTKDTRQNKECNNVPAKNTTLKKNTDKSPTKSKTVDGAKGRSLENTIKKMKEKIKESEKAKKVSSVHIPKVIDNIDSVEKISKESDVRQSNEIQELKSKEKNREGDKTGEFHSVLPSKDIEKTNSLQKLPDSGSNQQTDDVHTSKDKNDIEKKLHKKSISEESKQKPVELNDTKRKRSRSSSKSRISDKKSESGADKEITSHKSSRSRSSSKSRSLDKRSKHHSSESDRKRRSKSKSLDKDKSLTQEAPNGRKKRRSRSPSKPKSSDGKTKHASSERSLSKHRSSESKEKSGHTEDKKDRDGKTSSKSSPKSKSLGTKEKHQLPDKRKNEEKEKCKDKNEESKSKSDLNRSENKSNVKSNETHDKLKTNNVEIDKETKNTTEITQKVEHKSSKSKSKRQARSQESNSRKVDHDEKVENKASEKSVEKNKSQNSIKTIDGIQKVNEKDKHRDGDKTKPREKNQEVHVKPTHDNKRNDSQKKDDHSKNSDKSRRSHSKEKIKLESGSRTDKREKSSREKHKEDKKSNERCGDAKEAESKLKVKENEKVVTVEQKQRSSENEKKPHHQNDQRLIGDTDRSKQELIEHTSISNPVNHQNGSSILDGSKIKQEKNTEISCNATSSPSIDKDAVRTHRIEIPKKRKYKLYEENGNFLVQEKRSDDLPEAKIAKIDETVVNTEKSVAVQEKSTHLIKHRVAVDVVTASDVNTSEESYVDVEEIEKPPTPKIIEDKTEPFENALDISTTDVSYEKFVRGIKVHSNIMQSKDEEISTISPVDRKEGRSDTLNIPKIPEEVIIVNKSLPPAGQTEEIDSIKIVHNVDETIAEMPTVGKDLPPSAHPQEMNTVEIQSINEPVTETFAVVEDLRSVTHPPVEMQNINEPLRDTPVVVKDIPPAALPQEIDVVEVQNINEPRIETPTVVEDTPVAAHPQEIDVVEMQNINEPLIETPTVVKDTPSAARPQEIKAVEMQNINVPLIEIPTIVKDTPPVVHPQEIDAVEMQDIDAPLLETPTIVKDLASAAHPHEIDAVQMENSNEPLIVTPTVVKDIPSEAHPQGIDAIEIHNIKEPFIQIPTVVKDTSPAAHPQEVDAIEMQNIKEPLIEAATVVKSLPPADKHRKEINTVEVQSVDEPLTKIPTGNKDSTVTTRPEEINSNEVQICDSKSQFKEKPECQSPVKLLLQNEVPLSVAEPVFVNTVFSSSQNIGVRVLATPIDSTVKHLPGQDADLSLIPSVSSSVRTDCTTTTAVSMSCGVVVSSSLESARNNTEQEKTCLFTFNEDAGTVNRENLNTTDIFHTPIELDDISPTKLPLASNQSLDFISPSTSIAEISNSMNLVQTLGTSTINFVPDTSEIDIQQTSKQSSFGRNFVTRVTEISCFVDKESTADHNYTLGDPLLGGNNEDKNILTTGLSLSNSPEEFQLNESHLEDLSFNENNFIEENGTLEDLALFLPCKKEKPDFVCDNIMDEPIPKPEDIQNSIKRLNMLVDISQGGQQKTISVDSTIDQSSTNDCSVSLGIDYAVSKLLFLGGGEVTSQNNSFTTIPDLDNINIMESSVLPKQTLEDPPVETSREEPNILTPVCSNYSSFMPSDNQKVVVEPVEQYSITAVDQLKKDYVNDASKTEEKSKPAVKSKREPTVKTSSTYKSSKFATFLQSLKRDANKNENTKAKDDMENYTLRRHNRTPVAPPKPKTITQRQHTKSPPQSKKNEVLSFETNTKKSQIPSEVGKEGRIRVKTDLIKTSELKEDLNESVSSLEYINEHDHDIASEVVLPFSKPSPSTHKSVVQEKKLETSSKTETGTTKHARFDKMGNDYIMENILNVRTESSHKSPIQDTKTADKHAKKIESVDINRKRKLTPNDEIKRDDKRPRKSEDDLKSHPKKTDLSTSNCRPTSDDIFDKLLREGPVNKVFAQKQTDQNPKRESETKPTVDQLKNRGCPTVSELGKKDRTSQPQSTSTSGHDPSRYKDIRYQKRFGAHAASTSNPQLDRRYPEKRHISVPTIDTSLKRHMRSHPNSYSSKSDPCTTRDYRTRDRRMSTEHSPFPNSSKSELRHDDDEFSWIAKFSGSGLFDTPPGLFMPPGSKRQDASSRK